MMMIMALLLHATLILDIHVIVNLHLSNHFVCCLELIKITFFEVDNCPVTGFDRIAVSGLCCLRFFKLKTEGQTII